MTRATLVGFLVLGLACAGLAIAQFTRPAPPGGTQDGNGDPAPQRVTKNDLAVADLEREVEVLKVTVEGQREEILGLKEAIALIDARAVPVSRGPDRVAEIPIAAGLEEQVAAILDKREEDRRQKSREERVARMADYFLRDVQVTADQKKRFVEIVAAFWDERGKLMQRQYATPENRRAATEGLAADRDVKLQQIFDAAQFSQISERLDRMNRGPGGGNRGNRGGRGGGR